MHTLEEVLRMNGAVMIREGDGVFRIVPSAVAGKGNATPQLVETGKPLPGLQYPDCPAQAHRGPTAKILEPLAASLPACASIRYQPAHPVRTHCN